MGAVKIAVGAVGVMVALGVGFVWSFRVKYQPVQTALRKFIRRFVNPRQLRSAGQAGSNASVIHHVGRRTGRAYRTPVGLMPHDDGFLVALPYGPGTDWVRNVLASGDATVEHDGRTFTFDRPEVIPEVEVASSLPDAEQRVGRLFGISEYLRLRGGREIGAARVPASQ